MSAVETVDTPFSMKPQLQMDTRDAENIPPIESKKRSPSTPITHNRRRRKLSRNSSPAARISGSLDMLEMSYRNWLLSRSLQHSHEIVEFLRLERKFEMEARAQHTEIDTGI